MNEELIAEARKASKAVYLATDETVADDLSRILRGLADALEAKSVLSADNREASVIGKALVLLDELDLDSGTITAPGTAWGSILREVKELLGTPPPLPATPEPTEVTTVAELDALPDRSVVMAADDVFHYRDGLWCSCESARFGSEWLFKHGSPLKVLWVPVLPTEKSE